MKISISKSFWTSGVFARDYFRWWHNFTYWCRMHFTKGSWMLLKLWFKNYPYDASFMLEFEQEKLKEMIDYHQKRKFFVGWEYVVRDMKICVKLIDIILEKPDMFHFTGKPDFSTPDENGNIELLPGNLEYHCDVYVNIKNALRFINQKQFDSGFWTTKHPHELYRQKAMALYYKIRYEHTDEWWD